MLNAANQDGAFLHRAVVEIRTKPDPQNGQACARGEDRAVAVANEEAGSTKHRRFTAATGEITRLCRRPDHFWQAKRAVDALDIVLRQRHNGGLSSAEIDALLPGSPQ